MKKTPGDITVLHKCTKNNICYTAPEIRRVTAVIAIFHFGLFFTLIQPQKSKFKNKNEKKKPGDIIILHMCTKNYDQMMYGS